MPFAEHEGLRFFYFESLKDAGLVHGVFTREGGVSPAPWGSLNAGSRVGDAPGRVAENLARAALALGRDPASLVGVRQVHGNETCLVNSSPVAESVDGRLTAWDHENEAALPAADAVITQNPSTTLMMRFADCVPILLFDPVRRAAGIAHAGWRGTVSRVARSAVRGMEAAFGSAPGDLQAGIGPSICQAHYQVGPEVVSAVRSAFGASAEKILQPSEDRALLDLWESNRLVLEQAGVARIEIARECTVERGDLWYSHRAENGQTGRFAVLAGLEEV